MKLQEYLQKKYKRKNIKAITRYEAETFGIPYPLETGWFKKFGDMELPDYLAELTLDREVNVYQHKRAEVKARKMKRSKKWKQPHSRSYGKVSSDVFLSSYEWRKLRMEAIKKYGAKCQCCGATPGDGIVINVDHIKPRKLFPNLALDINNLQVLCNVCNHGKGNWDQTDWRGN